MEQTEIGSDAHHRHRRPPHRAADAAPGGRGRGRGAPGCMWSPWPPARSRCGRRPTVDERYARMIEMFGIVARQQLTCGQHIHVSVDSPDEGVAALDRIRGLAAACSRRCPRTRRTGRARTPATPATGRSPGASGRPRVRPRRSVTRRLSPGDRRAAGDRRRDGRRDDLFRRPAVRALPDAGDPGAGRLHRCGRAALIAALARALVDTAAAEWRHGPAARRDQDRGAARRHLARRPVRASAGDLLDHRDRACRARLGDGGRAGRARASRRCGRNGDLDFVLEASPACARTAPAPTCSAPSSRAAGCSPTSCRTPRSAPSPDRCEWADSAGRSAGSVTRSCGAGPGSSPSPGRAFRSSGPGAIPSTSRGAGRLGLRRSLDDDRAADFAGRADDLEPTDASAGRCRRDSDPESLCRSTLRCSAASRSTTSASSPSSSSSGVGNASSPSSLASISCCSSTR